MKVVLIKDVKGLGSKGDTVEQKDGYALNFLIPHGIAVPESSHMARNATQKKQEALGRKEVQHELLRETIEGLQGEILSFTKKVNEQGGLYDKIDAKEIVAKIEEVKKVLLPEDSIELEGAIEKAGDHEVTISDGEVHSTLTVRVEAE